jgi:hypothetical protein
LRLYPYPVASGDHGQRHLDRDRHRRRRLRRHLRSPDRWHCPLLGVQLRYGFVATDEASPDTLQQRYFTEPSGRLVGRITETQALVTARKHG